jgi:RimJ/RimL family protein N-acetyltransferase
MIDAKNYTALETLKNGLQVTIRAIQPSDRDDFQKAIDELDEHSIYMRFFQANKKFTDNDITQAIEVDFDSVVALVTCIPDENGEKIIGGGRYMAFGGNKAEVAFMARNGYHGLGIAGQMLKHLALIAKARGIMEFHAEVLSSNTGMLTVFKRSGFPIKLEYESDVTHVTLDIGSPK